MPKLNSGGLGKFLVSGLKKQTGKADAATLHAKTNQHPPRRHLNGGQPAIETQSGSAAIADTGRAQVLGSSRLLSLGVGTHTAGQSRVVTQTGSASGSGGGAIVPAKPTTDAPRHPPQSAGHLESETHLSAASGHGGGAKLVPQPKELAPRYHPQSDDQAAYETQSTEVVGIGDERAHFLGETQHSASPLIAELIQAARLRRRWHKAEKSLILQGRALCRAWVGGDKTAANALFDRTQAGEENDPTIGMALAPFLAAIERFASEREAIEKELRKLAKQLPVWRSFALGVKGLGDLRLALVVGECGDIGSYRNPSGVWKRMGLAVLNGERQRRKLDVDEALAHGYNAERRAMAYVLGTELIKAQLRAPKDTDGKRVEGEPTAIGPYGEVYLQRRAYEVARDIPKAHAHNRAARYMVKRLLRDLYAAWRKT